VIAVAQVPQFGTAAGTNFTDVSWKGRAGDRTLLHCMTTLRAPLGHCMTTLRVPLGRSSRGHFPAYALRWIVQRGGGYCARVFSVDSGSQL
jgi:hypothetical protein